MSITCRLKRNKKKFYTVIIVYLVLIVSTNVQVTASRIVVSSMLHLQI